VSGHKSPAFHPPVTVRARRIETAPGGGYGLLRDVVVAALETGCRRGELLSLQFWQIRFSSRAEIFLAASKTKTKRDRRVPMSSVLREILERRCLDPAGTPLPADGFVFGDEVGRRRKTIKDVWKIAVGRAKIDGLHFHDLRRECGSRWMDAGVPLAPFSGGSDTRTSRRRAPTSVRRLGADELDMQAFEKRSGRTVDRIVYVDLAS
jgi:integrase